jgi:glycosyltransferase involved in cell wall biosynthesis
VIATKVGGTPEVVEDGRTGILIPPRDAAACALALSALIADAPRRRDLGRRGRHRVEAVFSLDRMRNEYLRVYARLAV